MTNHNKSYPYEIKDAICDVCATNLYHNGTYKGKTYAEWRDIYFSLDKPHKNGIAGFVPVAKNMMRKEGKLKRKCLSFEENNMDSLYLCEEHLSEALDRLRQASE